MKKKLFVIFYLILIIYVFSSSTYTLLPKNPKSGEIFTLNINLYQLGILNIDKYKYFVKSSNPTINVISYKLKSNNGKFFLKINLQVFDTGKINLADLLFFDGNSYYSFNSISLLIKSNVDEQFFLPPLNKFRNFLLLRAIITYIVFIIFGYSIYFFYIKIKNSLILKIKRKKDFKKTIKQFNLLNKLNLEIYNSDLSESQFKTKLIDICNIVSNIIDIEYFYPENKNLMKKLNILNNSIKFQTYDNPQNIYKQKDKILSDFFPDIIAIINECIKNKYE